MSGGVECLEMMEEKRVTNALTFRSISAMLFAIFVIQPVIIYFNLLTNETLPLQAWIVILLWAELSRFFGSPLSIQEIFVLTAFGGMVTNYALVFRNSIFYMYLVTSPTVKIHGIDRLIPPWWAPTPDVSKNLIQAGSGQWIFLNSSWLLPILVTIVIPTALDMIAKISIGFFCYQRYVLMERLDFPAASAQANTIRTLAEREPYSIRILAVSATGGLLFNLLTSFIPFIIGPFLSGAITTVGVYRLVDFTPFLAQILPGAGFSISGDLLLYLTGFLMPINICLAMFIGAISINFFGTYAITRLNLWPPEAQASTITSWSVTTLLSQAHLYFLGNVWIGLAIAASILPLITRPKSLISIFGVSRKGIESQFEKSEGKLYFWLGLFLASTVASVLFVEILVGFRFPIWILLFYTVLWSFFASLVTTQAAGVTYAGLGIPYQRELLIYSSGYRDRDIWFAPVQLFVGGSEIAQSFRIADICLTKHRDYIKAYVIVVVLGLLSSFFYTSLFWFIQPM
ncbi:MAG: hypothetical protein QXU67_03890, partial [Candidatus Bathyarchaeia archaeon]